MCVLRESPEYTLGECQPSSSPACASSSVSTATAASCALNCGPIHLTGYALIRFQCANLAPVTSYITSEIFFAVNLPCDSSAYHLKNSFELVMPRFSVRL